MNETRTDKTYLATLYVTLGALSLVNFVALLHGHRDAWLPLACAVAVVASVILRKPWAFVLVIAWSLFPIVAGLAMWLAVLAGGTAYFHGAIHGAFTTVMLLLGTYFAACASTAMPGAAPDVATKPVSTDATPDRTSQIEMERTPSILDRYDGIEHRFSSKDADRTKGIEILTSDLGVSPVLDGLDYEISLYGGGSGIHDQLAFRFRVDATDAATIGSKLNLRTPEEAMSSPSWREGFQWLVCGNEPPVDIDTQARRFIDANRKPFQDAAAASDWVRFSDESDVNHWVVVWRVGEWWNYSYFDQG